MSGLEERRAEFERRLVFVRRSLAQETGWSLRGRGWLLALSAAAAGLAAGFATRRVLRERRTTPPSRGDGPAG